MLRRKECMFCRDWHFVKGSIFLDGECTNELAKMSLEINDEAQTKKLKTNHHFGCPYCKEKESANIKR